MLLNFDCFRLLELKYFLFGNLDYFEEHFYLQQFDLVLELLNFFVVAGFVDFFQNFVLNNYY